MNWQHRTEIFIGSDNLKTLSQCHVMVAGLGGVGGAAVEMLARAGITTLTLVDFDIIEPTNINRQIIATTSSIGKKKTDAWTERLKSINQSIKVFTFDVFISNATLDTIFLNTPDYVIDAIDTVPSKIELLVYCYEKGIPVVSSMGSGFKLDPSKVRIVDISETHTCRLAQSVRRKLRSKGIHKGIKVVFSDEISPFNNRSGAVGTISYMPNVFGCFCAAVVINDLLKKSKSGF